MSAWVLILVMVYGTVAHPLAIDMPSKDLCQAARQRAMAVAATPGNLSLTVPLAFCLPRSQEQ